jgi:UDP-N-acetylmuramoyl-L-alanyl-D-glutamate--2,6-diaminopimelate ligase
MHQAKLDQLVKHIQHKPLGLVPEINISGIAFDSRQVTPGNIFVALQGENFNGHRFISDAISRDAVAVIGTQANLEIDVPYFQVPDGRLALAQLSAAFYGFPARELVVIGVTGTDGKTTTANLVFNILKAAGIKAGMVTTVNALIGEEVLDTGYHVTTPEAPFIQGYLADMVSAGITHVVLETTSHGLAQKRVAACEFDIGVVTNITHEHLDYHGSYEDYRAAKAILLEELTRSAEKKNPISRFAVINIDDDSFEYLDQLITGLDAGVNRVTYGLRMGADIRAEMIIARPSNLQFSVLIGDEPPIDIESQLVGKYNVYNCLAAISATAVGLGIDREYIKKGIANMPGIPGRMEIIHMGQDFLAIVDFAHTPNALENALLSARELTDGNVIAIFGSAGLRDEAKRGMMAEISNRLADFTVLTAEDPRSESLPAILEDMTRGINAQGGEEGKTFWRVPDRGEAIRFGLSLANQGDVVISCGKGHEQSMCFGEIEYPWDDRTAMRSALADLLHVKGPAMPYLPTQER